MTVVQVLLVNVLTDGLPAVALSRDPVSLTAMERGPHSRTRLFGRTDWLTLAGLGALVGGAALTAYLVGRGDGHGQTMAFATVALAELVLVFSCRSPRDAAWHLPRNNYLLASVAASVAVVALAVYLPVTPGAARHRVARTRRGASRPGTRARARRAGRDGESGAPQDQWKAERGGRAFPDCPLHPLGEGGVMNENQPIVEARAASKTYDTGKVQVNALRERRPGRRAGRDGRRSWGRAAAARPRCSTASPASTRSTAATS